MKYSKILFLLTLIISSNLPAQNYGLGNADPSLFSKFRLPETRLHSLTLESDFSFSSQKSTNSTDSYYNDDYRYNSNFSFTPNYYLLNQSDDQILSVNLGFEGNYSNSYNKNRSNNLTEESTAKEMNYSLALDMSGDYKKYFNADNLFYSLGSTITINKNEQTRESRLENYKYNSNFKRIRTSFGIGMGKLRNVTPVVTAIRMQERLKVLNVLNNDLSENAIENLSQRLSDSNYFWNVHDRGGKYFLQTIEDVLSKDGITIKGLNQYSNAFLWESLNEIRFERYEGFNAGINFELSYFNNSNKSSFGEDNNSETLLCLGNIYFDYSHQMNLNSQLSFNISLNGGPDLIENAKVKQQYGISAGIKYDYELTDRLVTSAGYNFNTTFQNAAKQDKYLSHEFDLSARYFIEDQISMNLSYNLFYSEGKNFYEFTSLINSRSNNQVFIGLTYYFDRGMLQR